MLSLSTGMWKFRDGVEPSRVGLGPCRATKGRADLGPSSGKPDFSYTGRISLKISGSGRVGLRKTVSSRRTFGPSSTPSLCGTSFVKWKAVRGN